MNKAIKLRVILDTKEDVFRDIEILPSQSLEDLNNSIVRSFAMNPGEMASFYLSDEEWNQGEEIPLLDMGLSKDPVTLMRDTEIKDVFSNETKHMLYVYDFLNMWTFFVELIAITDMELDDEYPRCVYNIGETPQEAPSKDFSGKPAKTDIFGDAFGDEEDEDNSAFDEQEGFWN